MGIIIDTNLLLDDADIIYKLYKEYDEIIVPLTVLKELDKHKFNPDLAYSARSAIYSILNFKSSHPNNIRFVMDNDEVSSNDLLIIKTALENDSTLATKDISMSIIAEAKKVPTKLYSTVESKLHDPYIYVDVADLPENFFYPQELLDEDYYDFTQLLNLDNEQWFFVIIEMMGVPKYLYANNPNKHRILRIDNSSKYRKIKRGNIELKALDFYQICAIYAMIEADTVLLDGVWGTGKSLLATAYSLANNISKILVTRAPVGINSKYDIGFLPGDKNAKLESWFSGILSSVYFLYANTRQQISNKDKDISIEYDIVKDKYFQNQFEMIPINSIQGMSLLENDIMLCDEVQLLSIDVMSMLLSRANKGSKLILLGDLAQTYNVVRPSESGLLKLLRLLPNKNVCYVKLNNSYRGGLTELANMLQDKTIH